MSETFDLEKHCMKLEAILAIITPIQYMEIQKTKFFHDISKYTSAVDIALHLNKNAEPAESLAPIVAITGNHYLILTDMTGKMPDEEGNKLLEELICAMSKVKSFMHNPTVELIPAFDDMYIKWIKIEEYSKKFQK